MIPTVTAMSPVAEEKQPQQSLDKQRAGELWSQIKMKALDSGPHQCPGSFSSARRNSGPVGEGKPQP